VISLFVFKVTKPIIAQHGTFDIFVEIYLYCYPNSQLHELKKDTALAFQALEAEEKFSLKMIMSCWKDQTMSEIEQSDMEMNPVDSQGDM
jgi:hypothetical protein